MSSLVLAQADTTQGGGLSTLLFFGLLIATFYFFIIRPQRVRSRRQRELLGALEVGDEVQTIGGIQGRVVELSEDSVLLEVESGRMRMSRKAIAARMTEPEE